MHLGFIIYGERRAVEKALREMEAQKHPLICWDKKDKDKRTIVWIEGQVRQLPFGIYEYNFPKESLEQVLNTIGLKDGYYVKEIYKKIIRKVLGYKKQKEGEEGAPHYLWQTENTLISMIGIKEDVDIFDEKLNLWHEAI